jgi:hypothetical protein
VRGLFRPLGGKCAVRGVRARESVAKLQRGSEVVGVPGDASFRTAGPLEARGPYPT